MFKRIVIQLEGPICSCEEQSLKWHTGRESVMVEGKPTTRAYLQIACATCGTRLFVPNEKFVAQIKLDRLYPGKAPERVVLGVIDGGKVIPFENQHPKEESDGDEEDA